MNQFRDFSKFVAAIDSYGMQSGIVKVVPPPEWSVIPPLSLVSPINSAPNPVPPFTHQPLSIASQHMTNRMYHSNHV